MTNTPSIYNSPDDEYNNSKKNYEDQQEPEEATYYDVEDTYQKTKEGIGTAGKVGILGALGLGLGLRSFKRMVVGHPPSKLRKTLIYGSIAASLAWYGCKDDIKPVAKNTYEYLEGQQAQHIEQLTDELQQYKQTTQNIANQRDSLYNATTELSQQYQQTTQDIADQRDSLYNMTVELSQQLQTNQQTTPETLYLETQPPQHSPQTSQTQPTQHPLETYAENTSSQNNQENTSVQPYSYRTPQQQREEQIYPEGPCWIPLQQGQTIEDIAEEFYGTTEEIHRIRGHRGLQESENLPPGHPITLEDCPPGTHEHPIPEYEIKTALHTAHWMEDVRQDTSPEDMQFNLELGNNLYGIRSDRGIIYKKP